MNFHEIWYLSTFRKSVQIVQTLLQSDKNNGYFTWRPTYSYDNTSISLNTSESEKYSRQKLKRNQNTYFMLKNFIFFKMYRLWDNVEKYCTDRPQIKMWCTRIACWKPKATNTRSKYVIFIAFYCNACCTNASQCYVIRILPVLFNYLPAISEDFPLH